VKLKPHQETLLNAFADGEVSVDSAMEAQKLLETSEEARVLLKNIQLLKESLQRTAQATVSETFKEQLSSALGQAEPKKAVISTKRRNPGVTFAWLATAAILLLVSMLGNKLLSANENLTKHVAILEEAAEAGRKNPVKLGKDVMSYISMAHNKMVENEGPTFAGADVADVTDQINKQWDVNFKHSDFKIDAEFKGFCVCTVPGVKSSRRLSFSTKSDLGEEQMISLYIVDKMDKIDCLVLKKHLSKERVYQVGVCPMNNLNVLQWEPGKYSYFMVSKADPSKLVALMDQILQN
jgi:hypothetical protein